jgi:hypothetical protein
MAHFADFNPDGSRIFICGDALRPENGRIHQSYECGLEAASYFSGAGSISLAF